jgi:long-chain acyl-CoA synthetase
MTIELASLAGRAPNDCALVCDGLVVTGAVLNREADIVAGALTRLGVGPRHRVGVMHGNTPQFAAAVLGAMRLGASSMLLSTRSKKRDIIDAVTRAKPSVILADGSASTQLSAIPEIEAADRVELSCGVQPMQIWRTPYAEPTAGDGELSVQFTSGVSGRSKIVARTTANLRDELESFATDLNLSSTDATLCPCPISHTYAFVNGFLLPLFSGRPSVLMDWFLPNRAIELVRRYRARVFIGVPTMYRAMAEAYGAAGGDLASLRICFSAGAPLSAEVADAFRLKCGLPIHQQYGTTETGVIAINLDDDKRHVLSVGKPVRGRAIEIVDESGTPVRPTAQGEIVVYSPAAARAYIDDPALTAEKFRDGRYVTGDVGSVGVGGLRITGRRTSFINVAGLKVDPQEVERVLISCEDVAECAVVPLKDPAGGEVVRAVVVASNPVTAKKLQRFCKKRLAPHKVPREVTFVEALPRTATGKVLLKELIDHA